MWASLREIQDDSRQYAVGTQLSSCEENINVKLVGLTFDVVKKCQAISRFSLMNMPYNRPHLISPLDELMIA